MIYPTFMSQTPCTFYPSYLRLLAPRTLKAFRLHSERRRILQFPHCRGGRSRSYPLRPNYDRLAQVKSKYDPDNLFRLSQNIKPDRSSREVRKPQRKQYREGG